MTIPNGKTPATLKVHITNTRKLCSSRFDVESTNISSPEWISWKINEVHVFYISNTFIRNISKFLLKVKQLRWSVAVKLKSNFFVANLHVFECLDLATS